MSAPEAQKIIRSFDAVVEDVNVQRRSITARFNTSSRDRYNTVIVPRGCRHKQWRAAGGPILWEHGRHEHKDPIATADRIWNNGGPNPTELIVEPVFLDDEFSQSRFALYEKGVLRCWSVNALPVHGTFGPPTREELRHRPDWEGVDTVFRDWELIEISGTVLPGNAEALTCDGASKVMEMVERGLLLMPDEARPLYEAAMKRTAVVIPAALESEPRTTTDSQGGLSGGGATVKPDVKGKGKPRDDEDEEHEPDPDDPDEQEEDEDQEGEGRPEPARRRDAPEGIARHVIKKNGKFYVYNHDRTKKLAGPYSSRQAAVKRLQQIEYFKHQGERSAPTADPDPAPAPPRTERYIDDAGGTFAVREPDGRLLATYRDRATAEDCLRAMGSTDGYTRTLLRLMAEQRARMEGQVDDLVARIELKTMGKV